MPRLYFDSIQTNIRKCLYENQNQEIYNKFKSPDIVDWYDFDML